MDFENLKLNGFDLINDVTTQGWEVFLNKLKGLVYPALVKDFWIHAEVTNVQVFSSVMGKKFQISEKSLAKLLNNDGYGKICYQMSTKGKNMDEVVATIFQQGSTSGVKNHQPRPRI